MPQYWFPLEMTRNAITNPKHYPVIWVMTLHPGGISVLSFLRGHCARKPVVMSLNVGSFSQDTLKRSVLIHDILGAVTLAILPNKSVSL